MINQDDVFPIGQINKPHGINGEMSFSFTTDIFDSKKIPYLIIQTEGIYVPFYIESYRSKSNETGLIKLEGINNEEKARLFAGLSIYLPKIYLEVANETEIELDYFIGFVLIDETFGEIGEIAEVDQTTENALFVIEKKNDELLIPVGDDYIQEIDHESKRLYVDLPDGLLSL